MFGLFQADLPIGNRLWLTLLAIVVGGSIAATPLAEVASNPIDFGVNLLLLFGQATLVTSLYLVLPFAILGIIEFEVKTRADKNRNVFFLETEDYEPLYQRIINFSILAGYVIAVFWIADGNFSASLGSFGLALFLFVEVWSEWREVYMRGYEYLELQRIKNVVKARIIKEETVEKYSIREGWIEMHAYLGDNNWDLLEFSKSFSLHRRNYRKGLLPQRWLKSFPKAFASLLAKRSVRRRFP